MSCALPCYQASLGGSRPTVAWQVKLYLDTSNFPFTRHERGNITEDIVVKYFCCCKIFISNLSDQTHK